MLKSICVFLSLFLVFTGNALAHSRVSVIEMDSNGFSPVEITIDSDSSIIFVNKDTQPRWPASNTHPTHELYSEFDPRKPIAPGQSWAFKPKKVGSWKFHDHLFPHMRGTLTVIEEKNPTEADSQEIQTTPPRLSPNTFAFWVKSTFGDLLAKITSTFSSKSSLSQKKQLPSKDDFKKLSYNAQSKELTELAKTNGPSAPWGYIKDVYKNEGGSSGNIHDLAHLSGLLIYAGAGFEGIKDCSSQFAFGCYHGFLDKAFSQNLDHLPDAQNACLRLGPEGSGPVASCIHGIGHGIASYFATTDLKKALSFCRKLTTGSEYCFDGVFMEFVRSAPLSFFKKEDPLFPCNELEKSFGYSYSFSCGRNQPSLLMGRFAMGFTEVIGVCLSSDSKPFKEACFDSLGFSVASSGNAEQIIEGCKKIGVLEYTNRCIKAAAGELVFQDVPGWYEKSQAVCNGSGERDDCLQNVNRIIQDYNKKIRINFIPKLPSGDINEYVQTTLGKCFDINGRDGCYKQAADALYDQFGLRKTLDVLKKNEQHPKVYARCHEVTHYLSRREFDQQGSIAKVYSKCDATCHGGCYHGTLEAYLKKAHDQNLQTTFATICGKQKDYQKPLEFNECFHGLGHAAMFVNDMELLTSLKLCDTISDHKHKERCFTGVFMENSSSSTSFDHVSKYIKTDDPFYPCNSMEEKYQALCWQYQSSYFSIISNQDWEKVADLCLQIPEEYQDRCFRTIGTNQVGFTTSLQTMKHDCGLMPSEHFKDICVAGVVSSLSYRFVGDMQKMIDFCTIADTENRESCFKQVGSGILDWNNSKDVAKKECKKIPDPQGQAWCISVI